MANVTGPCNDLAAQQGGRRMMVTNEAQDIAERAAEAVRELIHATQAAKGALAYPADVYEVVGALETMAGRLPQAYGQLADWLDREAEAQRLRVPEGLF